MQFVVFSKHLQEYSIERALQAAKEIGLNGLDLTVRPGGHIEPENVEAELPQAVAAARDMGLDIPMITTSITRSDSPGAKAIFTTAAKLGIQQLKLGYWPYEEFGSFRDAIGKARSDIATVEQLARKHNVCACLHVHSGRMVTSSPPVVARLIRAFDPEAVGCYPDPAHMMAEGAIDGWRQGLELLLYRARMIGVKEFKTELVFEDGRPRNKTSVVPLEEGPVDWKLVFEYMNELGFDGVVSLHSEYDLPAAQVVEQTKKDWAYLQELGVV